MGMYNEVTKSCPRAGCGGVGLTQIRQIVLGFGGFSLDSPDDLAQKLTVEQLHELHSLVQGKWFVCGECGYSFMLSEKAALEERLRVARELFGDHPSPDGGS